MLTFMYLMSTGLIFGANFCRMVKISTHTTKTHVVISIYLLAVSSVGAFMSPLFWGHEPDLYETFLAFAFAVAQLIGNERWRDGVPHEATKSGELDDRQPVHQ